MRHYPKVWFVIISATLIVALIPACSVESKKARHQSRADKYYDSDKLSRAEVEYLNVLQLEAQNSHALGRLGTIYFEQGRFMRAYPFLKEACRVAPNDIELQMKLGTLASWFGETKQAREKALFVLDKLPSHPDAPMLLAESVHSRKDFEEVHSKLEGLAKQSGNPSALQVAFGTLFLREGNLKAAEAAAIQSVVLDPKSSAAHFALAKIRLLQQDTPGADTELKAAAELAGLRSVRRLSYADFKIKSGDLETGKRLMAEMTRQVPDFLPAWVRQAEIALAERHYTNCAYLLEQGLTRDPGNFEILLLKARLLVAQGETTRAIGELERLAAIPNYDRSPQVHYHLALAHLLNTNDTARALKSATRAVALQPQFDDAIMLQARICLARDDPDAAIAPLTELHQRRTNQPQAQLLLGAAYRAKGNLDQALDTYRRLSEQYPKNPDTPFLMGQIYAQQNRIVEAREAFVKTIEITPRFLPAVEYLVRLDLLDKEYARALSRVEQHMDKTEDSPVLQLLKGRIYTAQGDTPKAEAALLKAIELSPENQEAYLLLAQLYVRIDEAQKALAKLRDALERKPSDIAALLLTATIQEQLKDFASARKTYEQILAAYPSSYMALNNLAVIYCEHFRLLDQAYDLARKARDIATYNPKSGAGTLDSRARQSAEFFRAFSTDTLGWILLKRGELSWALSLFQESAALLAKEPGVQFHLGMAYYMLGREDRARAALKRALEQNPEFSDKAEADRRLALLAIDGKTADARTRALLEKELGSQVDDPVVLARLAAIYERENTPDKALKAYEAAWQKNPKSVSVLLVLASRYSKPSQFQNRAKALDLAKQAYKLSPNDPEIVGTLGRLAFQAGDYRWAVSLLQQHAGKQDRDPELLYDFALACYSVGRTSDAEMAMRNALEADAGFSRTEEAKRFLQLVSPLTTTNAAMMVEPLALKTIETNPDDVPALMIAALCAEQRGNRQVALRFFERVEGLYPDFTPALKHLAMMYSDSGDYHKAYEMATKARQAFPEDAEVARSLGIALYERKDYRSSARLLLESVQRRKEDSTAMYYLGLAHNKLKEWKESKQALEGALALNLERNLAENARRILTEQH